MTAARKQLSGTDLDFYALASLPKESHADPSGLPMTVKVLLEGLLRLSEAGTTHAESGRALSDWPAAPPTASEPPFLPTLDWLPVFTVVLAGLVLTPSQHT